MVLYQWHAELSATTFGMLHCFEVLFRNAIDRMLAEGQPQDPLHHTWLLHLGTLRPAAVKQVVVAVERCGMAGRPSRSEVVARLPFGFWAALFGRRYDRLWQTRLHRVFPHGDGRREEVGECIARIHELRNRIAHHDSLLDQDVAARVREMLALAGWIDPAAPAWLRRAADVEAVVTRRP